MKSSFQKIETLNFDILKSYPLEIDGNIEVDKTESRASKKSAYRKFLAENNQQPLAFCQESLTDQFKAGTLQQDVNAKRIDPCTLIHRAILENSPEVIQFLLDHGVDVDYPDENSMSPLTIALLNRCDYAIDVLLDHGASVNPKVQWNGMSLLEIAFFMRDWENALKLANAGANTGPGKGTSFLTKVIDAGQIELAKSMINNGIDITAYDAWYATGLACGTGDVSLLELMFQKGYDVNHIDTKYNTNPLIIRAIQCWNIDVIKFLLKSGADLNTEVVMCGGETALIATMHQHGNLEKVKLLVELGADVNKQCYVGGYDRKITPIKFAIDHGYPEIVQYLLQHGARA